MSYINIPDTLFNSFIYKLTHNNLNEKKTFLNGNDVHFPPSKKVDIQYEHNGEGCWSLDVKKTLLSPKRLPNYTLKMSER